MVNSEERTTGNEGEVSPEEAIFNMMDDDTSIITTGEVEDDGSSEAKADAETSDTEVEEDEEEAEAESNPDEEPSDDETDANEESEEESEETEDTYTLKIEGKDVEVTGDELLNGYLRQKDYTRKTQTLAEDRKALEVTTNNIQTEREQYVRALEWFKVNSLGSELSKLENTDWDTLKAEDPTEWQTKRLEYQEARDRVAKTEEEQRRVATVHEQTRAEEFNKAAVEEAKKLYEIAPALKEESERVKLRDYALSNGVTKEQLNNLVDSTSLNLLYKAMLYDSSEKKVQKVVKKKVKKNTPKFVKSGSTPTSKEQISSKVKSKKDRLSKTGDVHDAADLFFDLNL